LKGALENPGFPGREWLQPEALQTDFALEAKSRADWAIDP
jgi:hypothetical protein